ncbi:MAG: hypothetical protein IJE55_04510 [Clostridia bacterium]|nr:hypothetical protein [Clostridia bacterium]
MNVKKYFPATKKRILYISTLSLGINILYSVANFALGIWSKSYWFLTMGAYNLILVIMRASVIKFNKQSKSVDSARFIQAFVGAMLVLLSFVLGATVYLSVKHDVAQSFHKIIMITIATYTFTKITLAIVNYIKKKKFNSHIVSTLRGITLCDATASVYSMQKSMLVSFQGMTASDIRLMNILTGTGVFIVVCLLGIIMIINSRKEIKNG